MRGPGRGITGLTLEPDERASNAVQMRRHEHRMIERGRQHRLIGRLEISEQRRFDVLVDQPQWLAIHQAGGDDAESPHEKRACGIGAQELIEPDAEAHLRRSRACNGRTDEMNVSLLKNRALPDVAGGGPLEQHDGVRAFHGALELFSRGIPIDAEDEMRSEQLHVLLEVCVRANRVETGAQFVRRVGCGCLRLPAGVVRLEDSPQERGARTMRVGVGQRRAEAAHVYRDDMRIRCPKIVSNRKPLVRSHRRAAFNEGAIEALRDALRAAHTFRAQMFGAAMFRRDRFVRAHTVVHRFPRRPGCASCAPLAGAPRAHNRRERFNVFTEESSSRRMDGGEGRCSLTIDGEIQAVIAAAPAAGAATYPAPARCPAFSFGTAAYSDACPGAPRHSPRH